MRYSWWIYSIFSIVGILFFILACETKENVLFHEVEEDYSHIDFVNRNQDTDSFNILDYLYFYNGAGVAVADFNNDSLLDIYFVSNTESNQLYFNQGKLKFKNVTDGSGVAGTGSWKTGVTVVDINQDGWQDIYLCTVSKFKNFEGKNQLFVNQRDGTFLEQAHEYGLDIQAFSTQASFFDYDKDGDLDLLLLNHSVHSSASYGDSSIRHVFSEVSGPHLYQNDHQFFKDVSQQAGLFPSALSYGLGLSIGDINNDGWEDIYISNDFHENDYLFVNQHNGKFIEKGKTMFGHFSNFSMGNAMEDMNNDGFVDIISTDMLPLQREELFAAENELPNDVYDRKHSYGYHYQLARNALQLNSQDNHFSDIALYAGVAATDWTWSVLAEDFDHDGKRELFFSNGIKRRLNDLDYIKYLNNVISQKRNQNANDRAFDKDIMASMPNGLVTNLMFKRKGEDMKFENVGTLWGWNEPSASSGSVAADLDNDGDLDIITNDMNQVAHIRENKTNELYPSTHYLQIRPHGEYGNLDALGLRVLVRAGGELFSASHYAHDGFMSGRLDKLHIGLGKHQRIDSLLIIYPSHSVQLLYNIDTRRTIDISEGEAKACTQETLQQYIHSFVQPSSTQRFFTTHCKGLEWTHRENVFYDNNTNLLIPHFYSREGAVCAVGDLNGDGLEDVYLGGARFQPKPFAIQKKSAQGNYFDFMGHLDDTANSMENIAAVIADMNNDHKNDIVVACAGNEESYLPWSGVFVFEQMANFRFDMLPIVRNKMAQDMLVSDINQDGRMDIVLATRVDPMYYARGSEIHVFINYADRGYIDETRRWIPLSQISGIITDIAMVDLDGDGWRDLLVAGEWMQIMTFYRQRQQFSPPQKVSPKGMWQSLAVHDIDHDGRMDILAGNWGENTKLHASESHPLRLYYGNLSGNQGQEDLLLSQQEGGKYYPFLPKNQLEDQLPFLKKKFRSYRQSAKYTVLELFEGTINKDSFWEAETLSSAIFLQTSKQQFSSYRLPEQTQYAPIRASLSLPEGDGFVVGTNFAGVSIQEGRYDAGLAGIVQWNHTTHSPMFIPQLSLSDAYRNAITDMQPISIDSEKRWLILYNNAPLRLLRLAEGN